MTAVRSCPTLGSLSEVGQLQEKALEAGWAPRAGIWIFVTTARLTYSRPQQVLQRHCKDGIHQ
jgi:hypothetical protein